jgi:hypothetical protein
VLVPRKDRLHIPSLFTPPYTRTNPSIEIFRHATAIDERRRMFRLNRWTEPQQFAPNPSHKSDPVPQQDIKQVWFAGVNADIGGGYPESESAIYKYPLHSEINEAKRAGLRVNRHCEISSCLDRSVTALTTDMSPQVPPARYTIRQRRAGRAGMAAKAREIEGTARRSFVPGMLSSSRGKTLDSRRRASTLFGYCAEECRPHLRSAQSAAKI